MLNEVKNKLFSKIDVWLLTSILLIMNVSTSFKLLGVLILFFYKPTILKSIKQNKFSLFYLLMIGIVLLQVLFRISDINESIIKINLIASIIWGISLFALIQITRIVSDIEITKIQNTIVVLFLINAVYSIGELVGIMLEIGTINPYTYNSLVINPLTDMSLYGGATGDYIGGVFRTHSIHNAFFNLIGVIYFLMNKKYLMSMISLIILLLTTSNLVVLILFFTIFSVLFFHPSKTTKYVVLLLVLISTVFYTKVSPNNFEYARKTLVKSTVKFLGHVTREELFNELSVATAAIFPSYSECFSLAPLEAMAVGCPVINSRLSSGAELVVDKENGALIQPTDIVGMANTIIEMIENKELQKKYSINGLATIHEKFTIEKSAKDHIAFYNEVISDFRRK